MSVQFGRWNFDGRPVSEGYLKEVKSLMGPYAPDRSGHYSDAGISILFHAFATTKESRHETQPHLSPSSAVITWDGRLDNRADLLHELGNCAPADSTDASIVAAAYEKWGTSCLARLVGDWALSIWNPTSRSVVLAKDPIGIRHLYYFVDDTVVTWSTILHPSILSPRRSLVISEEYIAGWFSSFPALQLTPFVGVQSVEPSSCVVITMGKQVVTKYWDFDATRKMHYRSDAEYEEHFRSVLREAVRRRLRSDTPVLAELSGGMDSSAIVCVADDIIAQGDAETPRLDTLSYYNDSEPHWNERPYFAAVEKRRGRAGHHINVGSPDKPMIDWKDESLAVTPASPGRLNHAGEQFAACMTAQGNRVLLSGLGGDEVAGGVPTPLPELEDLLITLHLGAFAHQLKLWALAKRKPWFHILFETIREFLPLSLGGLPENERAALWLRRAFVRRNQAALRGYHARLRVFGALPSFQNNMATLEALRRQLACDPLPLKPLYEKRYPFLDRDLLAFLYSIPRQQMVRPGQRRSLMRRALAGIVPQEILERRRKAYVVRASIETISAAWPKLAELTAHMLTGSLGIVDPSLFVSALQKARQGIEVPIVTLLRTLNVEFWLRNLQEHRLLRASENHLPTLHKSAALQERSL